MESKDNEAELSSVKLTFTQDDDSYQSTRKGYQQLDITLDNAGGGLFYAIKTERWSFDDIDELINLLKRVQPLLSKPITEENRRIRLKEEK